MISGLVAVETDAEREKGKNEEPKRWNEIHATAAAVLEIAAGVKRRRYDVMDDLKAI